MKKLSAILATALVLVMVLSMLPMGAAAASNWTEVELSAVTASDSIAIVYVKDGASYAMLNNAEKGPLVTFDASSTTATTQMLWNVTAVTGGYNIKPYGETGKYLYLINDNNGVRVGTTSAVWSVTDYTISNVKYTYLTTMDLSSNLRTLGVYNTANFRAYKLSSGAPGNTVTKQTVKFYKWTGGSVTDTRQDLPTEQTKIVDAIFNLTSGEALSKYYKYTGEITLTGTVSGSTTWYEDSSNGNVNFKVKDSSGNEKIMQAYKLSKGTDTTNDDVKNLTTGDTITVKGSVIKNFSGTYELDTCTLVSVEKVPASGTGTTNSTATAGTQAPGDTGDSTGIVGMTAIMVIAVTALAALVIGNKKRMF